MKNQEILDEDFPEEKSIIENTELPDIFLQLLFLVGAIISISSTIQLYNGYFWENRNISITEYLPVDFYLMGVFYGFMMMVASVLGFVNGKKAINFIYIMAFSSLVYLLSKFIYFYPIAESNYLLISGAALGLALLGLRKYPNTIKENNTQKMISGVVIGLAFFAFVLFFTEYYI